ncbi:MAG: UDP-N-acetylmuramoyl-tripeptide--D-alanyl-D-alanine ligase [Nitrospirae bacterium]|nr:UDP-N-acetylmuramoyl-tripeptide--D-alanyl-D-alanine ligase [Nitrospirota bacterium]
MKDTLNINEILSAAKGRLVRGDRDVAVSAVSIDTRTIKNGELFVAVKGGTFDGHDFVLQAFEMGACGAVIDESQSDKIEKRIKDSAKALIAVDDTITALQDMAAFHRQKYYIRVIAVTGTNGKTTTKEMIARILGQRLWVLRNEGNLNNHIGVPLTLLRLNKKHQAAVIEMGMSGLGEIRRLCEIAAPDIGVVTNIGAAHLEGLGSIENVIKAKGEIVESLSESDTAVINADDKNSVSLKNKAKGKVVTFGIDNDADIRAVDIRHQIPAGTAFSIIKGKEKIDVSLSLSGRHNIYNALAAAAASVMLNFDLEDVKAGLEGFKPFKMRSEIVALNSGVRIINDSYNANPASMEAAIRLLSDFKNNGRTFAALGGMFELSDYTKEAHYNIGRAAVDSGIDYLIVVGEIAGFIASGALSAGMKQDNIFVCVDHQEAIQILNKLAKSGDTVLIKGSRKMAMERIAEGLMRGDKRA